MTVKEEIEFEDGKVIKKISQTGDSIFIKFIPSGTNQALGVTFLENPNIVNWKIKENHGDINGIHSFVSDCGSIYIYSGNNNFYQTPNSTVAIFPLQSGLNLVSSGLNTGSAFQVYPNHKGWFGFGVISGTIIQK